MKDDTPEYIKIGLELMQVLNEKQAYQLIDFFEFKVDLSTSPDWLETTIKKYSKKDTETPYLILGWLLSFSTVKIPPKTLFL